MDISKGQERVKVNCQLSTGKQTRSMNVRGKDFHKVLLICLTDRQYKVTRPTLFFSTLPSFLSLITSCKNDTKH